MSKTPETYRPKASSATYPKLVEEYEKNKHKKWDEWLELESIFPRSGKQGLVGIFRVKDTDSRFVFKVSRYINYLVQHEMTVMRALNKLEPFCLHFCKGIGGILADINPNVRKEGNPFKLSMCKYPIEKEVLLTEYIPRSTKFYNYIRSSKVTDTVLYSTVKQTLMAIRMAQNLGFTHYDLHSNNIMMKKCNKDLVFLYILDDEHQYCIPTYGSYPVIIDFGFSYADTMKGGPLWPSLGHTEIGFTSDRFDPYADPKLFLVTVSGEIHEKRDTKDSKKLVNIVKNLFSPLSIDWNSGWDRGEKHSAAEYVLRMIKGLAPDSELFTKYDHFCIDILQSLIILPLQEQSYSTIDKSFKAFSKEFVKIEQEIGNPFYCLYLLKNIVDSAREVRADYIRGGVEHRRDGGISRDGAEGDNSRKRAIRHFSKNVYECIDSITKFCQPKDVHFEKMLCGLLCLAKNIEGVFYDVMVARTKKKEREYNKLPLKTIEQMYAAIEINIPDSYEFNENTTVLVMDAEDREAEPRVMREMTLTEKQTREINETHSLSRGVELYKIMTMNDVKGLL